MNPNRSLLRLLIFGQMFMLAFLILMPLVIRWLPGAAGKGLYVLLVSGAVILAVFLRRALPTLGE